MNARQQKWTQVALIPSSEGMRKYSAYYLHYRECGKDFLQEHLGFHPDLP